MASPRSRRVMQDLRPRDDNNNCFECGSNNPQWVNVTYGVWICFECSQKHRWLGDHLSCVRSVRMDELKDSELEKMKVGGNRKAKNFLESQSDWNKIMPISVKYNTKAAALYRDKINTEAQGKTWSNESSSACNFIPSIIPRQTSSSSLQSQESNNDFYGGKDEWQSGYQSGNYDSYQGNSYQGSSSGSNIPVNQGGKYEGFGFSMDPPPRSSSQDFFDGAWSPAVKFGSIASQTVVEPGETVNEKVKEGKIVDEFSSQVSSLSNKVADLGGKEWQDISSSISGKPTTTLATAEGAPTEKSSLLGGGGAQGSRNRQRVISFDEKSIEDCDQEKVKRRIREMGPGKQAEFEENRRLFESLVGPKFKENCLKQLKGEKLSDGEEEGDTDLNVKIPCSEEKLDANKVFGDQLPDADSSSSSDEDEDDMAIPKSILKPSSNNSHNSN